MNQVTELKILDNYNVWLKFKDGFSGIVNLKPFLGKGLAKDLLEKNNFNTLNLEAGGISFSNGYDFCPNFLRTLTNKTAHNKVSYKK